MSRRRSHLQKLEQINILQAATRQRQSEQEYSRLAFRIGLGLVALFALICSLNLLVTAIMEKTLYCSPTYALQEVVIEPPDRFSSHQIRETAGLEMGQNLWTLNLPKIAGDLEALPNISSAHIERHFPNRLVIRLIERIPVAKLYGQNVALGTREMFYLDREGVVLKPRVNDSPMDLPEIVGWPDLELEPGKKLDQPNLANAFQILEEIEASPLRIAVNVTKIDVSKPLFVRITTERDRHETLMIFRVDCVHQEIDRMEQILDLANSQQKVIRQVDLSLYRYVPVTFYE